MKELAEQIIKLIKVETKLDISKNKSRKRDVVECKMLFCKLMRDAGHTYESIGKSINFGHATAIYHVKNFEHIKKFSPFLQRLDISVRASLLSGNDDLLRIKIKKLQSEIEFLEEILSQSTKKV